MKITNHISLVGFLLTLSALNIQASHAATTQPKSIAERLNRINNTIKEQEAQLPNMPSNFQDMLMARAWRNGGRGFANRGGGGFINRGGGGWRDGGGFYNRGGGRGFVNRGGGFVNRGGGGFANRGGGFANRGGGRGFFNR